jgi:uncharacterized membrane protein YfcA
VADACRRLAKAGLLLLPFADPRWDYFCRMPVILFFFLALVSEIVGTIGGFGSSVFFVPLAGLFFDFHTVLSLTSILHVFSNAAKLVLFGKHVQWRLLLLLGIPSVICVILGALLSTRLQFKYSELILGLFLIAFSVLFYWKPLIKLSANNLNAIGAGGIAGFLAGVIGTGGAIRGLALTAFDLDKGVFVATSAAIDSGVDFSRMIVYLRANFLATAFYRYVPGLLLVAFAGSYLGKVALNRLEQRNFRRIVLLLIFLIGLTTLGKALEQLRW